MNGSGDMTSRRESGARFAARNAIITGAAQGVGRAVARRLAAEGARVFLVDKAIAACQASRDEIRSAGGTAEAIEADLEQARLDLARIEVRASLPGIVSKPPKPGQYVAAGTMAMALVVTGNLWIEANFTETDLTHVHPGQPVTIHVDTYPDAVWKGIVESLSPATGAEFSIIPAQNATGNWIKIVQRVPVRIKIEPAPGMPQLWAGLSTTVEIDTGHRRRLLEFSF